MKRRLLALTLSSAFLSLTAFATDLGEVKTCKVIAQPKNGDVVNLTITISEMPDASYEARFTMPGNPQQPTLPMVINDHPIRAGLSVDQIKNLKDINPGEERVLTAMMAAQIPGMLDVQDTLPFDLTLARSARLYQRAFEETYQDAIVELRDGNGNEIGSFFSGRAFIALCR